ncbi:hypothetical protein HDU82_004486 [Entophlyctis luteolus]|nr:hypothetical protein HDU82_004486 [Entophlyctis luteolus]
MANSRVVVDLTEAPAAGVVAIGAELVALVYVFLASVEVATAVSSVPLLADVDITVDVVERAAVAEARLEEPDAVPSGEVTFSVGLAVELAVTVMNVPPLVDADAAVVVERVAVDELKLDEPDAVPGEELEVFGVEFVVPGIEVVLNAIVNEVAEVDVL